MQSLPYTMEEDVLSDVVPSNIVSRQVCKMSGMKSCTTSLPFCQPSEGADGESEYVEDGVSEQDELISEDEVEFTKVGRPVLFTFSLKMPSRERENPRQQKSLKFNKLPKDNRENKNGRLRKASCRSNGKKWTRQRFVPTLSFSNTQLMSGRLPMPSSDIRIFLARQSCSSILWILRSVKIISFIEPHSDYPSKRARDPEYAALMDAQPKPKGRGRKRAAYVQ